MEKIDARKEIFEHIKIFGKDALFTNCRIDRCTIPMGIFCYDLRGSDYDPGRPACLEAHVVVNHAGTVLTAERINIPESGYKRLNGKLNFLGDDMKTLKQFCKIHQTAYDIQRQSNAHNAR